MNWEMYVRLSAMTFLQFAIWGAWSPVLAARLFGPLKMTGKQVGWVYGTMYLGCIVSPLACGVLTDRWVATQWFLVAAHALGGLLLLIAARRTTFCGLFVTMLLYALTYGPTITLTTALTFRHKGDMPFFAIQVWGGVAWVLVGWLLTAWRRRRGTGEGNDCLVLAGLLAVAMAVYSVFLPDTPPKAQDPLTHALSLLKDPNFVLFLAVSFVVASQLQFYFLGTASYLGDLGVESKNVPAVMSIAQAAQFITTLLVAIFEAAVLGALGFKWAIALGAAAWLAMYGVFALTRPRWLIICAQALHGIAYQFFIGVAFIYIAHIASKEVLGSATGLYSMVLYGFGLFAGTQFTGVVMDRLKVEGKFRWRAVFLVPCALLLACAIALGAFFRTPAYKPASGQKQPPAGAEASKGEEAK
ncbi:MAG: hypothetical protein FJ291_21390 [Planctomycetes bacterium]|nr:hypothetical protein [Planctomycetota bacterium]